MAKVLVTESYLDDIGDAIREQLDVSTQYHPSEMGDAVRSIEGGYPEPTGTKTITANGTGIDVKDYALADVAVPNTYTASDEGKVVDDGALVAQGSQTITENGTYDTTLIAELIANIEGGGGGGVKKTLLYTFNQSQGSVWIDTGVSISDIETLCFDDVESDELIKSVIIDVADIAVYTGGADVYTLIFTQNGKPMNARIYNGNLYVSYNGTGASTYVTEVYKYEETQGGSVNILSGTDAPTSSVGSDGAIYLQTTPFGAKNVGGQYIDTGYSGNANSKYVIDFKFDKAQSSYWVCPFGGRPNPNSVYSASLLSLAISSGDHSQASAQWGSDLAIGTGWNGATGLQGRLIHAEVSAGLARMSADGNQFPDVTWTPTAVTDTTHIGLFAALANNAYQSWSYMDEMVLYRFQIYESDVLVHDFVPTIDQNDVVCIKDNVSGEYKYPNSGTLVGVPESDDIFATYLKVNGAWQNLIGSDIDDVDTGGVA